MTIVLLVPAVLIVVCFFVILFGVKESPEPTGGVFDTVGLILISLALICFTGGLSLLRLEGGLVNPWSWTVVVLGILLVVPFVLWELRHDDPLIDVRMFRSPALGPVFLTAGLFGVSVLGAQAPLSTFARTDPDVYGYGLGTTGFATSLIIGIYLIAMIVGALLFPSIARLTAPRADPHGSLDARRHRVPAVPAVPRHVCAGHREHGDRRPGLRCTGGRAARGGGIRCSRRPRRASRPG